ncbi:MAG TPA: glycosyltransferase family 4 protein [Vicinamibacterales bacterium]|nr:glycosyltransferase family 4 protein [Vicinamibacterales bacterium]
MSRALSILLVGDYPPDETLGSPKVFYKLQAEFQALGHHCDIMFAPEIGGPSLRQVRQVLSPWHAGNAIVRRLEAGRYDVVDAASAEGLFFGILKKFAIYKQVAYVCRSNGLEHLNYRRMLEDAREGLSRKPWFRRLWYPVSRLSQVAAGAHLSDRLLLLNDRDRDYALSHGWQQPDRIDVIPHGVSDHFLNDDPGPDAPRGEGLLFCGSWDQVKGIHYLVQAFDRIAARLPQPRLTVLGPGVPASAVLRAFSDRSRHLVRVVDRAPEADVIRALRTHDVLLWPSTYEGFGLVLIEAMSQRLAVVATPVGCGSSVVRDGVNGLVVPARDAEALAAAAERLIGDAALRRRLGSAARAAVAGLSWRACAERTIACYRAALNGRGA